MNKTNHKDLRDTIANILIDTIASTSEACDTTTKIMQHVEKALEDAYDTGQSEGYDKGFDAGYDEGFNAGYEEEYEEGYLECEHCKQEHSEADF